MTARLARAAPILLFVLAACSGPSGSTADTSPPERGGQAAADPEEQEKLARLQSAQDAACDKMCRELTECAVEDARQTMSAQELAELDLEQTAARHTEDCNERCRESSLSPRQVRVIQDCLTTGGTCDEFIGCLDEVQRRDE